MRAYSPIVFGDDAMNAGRCFDRAQRDLRAKLGERLLGRSLVEHHAPANKEVRIVVAEHGVGIRHGRLGAAAPVAGRPGSAPAECGPTRSNPTSSIETIDPPPAPISIMSITAALTGRPEPFLKRCMRATSIADATAARPFRSDRPSRWC